MLFRSIKGKLAQLIFVCFFPQLNKEIEGYTSESPEKAKAMESKKKIIRCIDECVAASEKGGSSGSSDSVDRKDVDTLQFMLDILIHHQILKKYHTDTVAGVLSDYEVHSEILGPMINFLLSSIQEPCEAKLKKFQHQKKPDEDDRSEQRVVTEDPSQDQHAMASDNNIVGAEDPYGANAEQQVEITVPYELEDEAPECNGEIPEHS